jgi:hypothetical protein
MTQAFTLLVPRRNYSEENYDRAKKKLEAKMSIREFQKMRIQWSTDRPQAARLSSLKIPHWLANPFDNASISRILHFCVSRPDWSASPEPDFFLTSPYQNELDCYNQRFHAVLSRFVTGMFVVRRIDNFSKQLRSKELEITSVDK